MAEIESCPFCGGECRVYRSGETGAFFAVHRDKRSNCFLRLPIILRRAATLEEAEEIWNRRAGDLPAQ